MMMFSWRRRRAARRMARGGGGGSMAELTIPSHFLCPISLDLMKDPVTMSTGITYDRANIETWIEGGNFSCPFTNQPLHTIDSIPNHNIRKMIQAWCVENRAHGIERIPTPRVPASPVQVREILDKIAAAVGREDCDGCKSLVEKIKILVQESERNKKCIIANGTGNVLSSAFEAFSKPERFEKRVEILEEILSTMAMIFPLQEEAIKHLKSEASMQALVWFVRGEDKSRRRSSILVLKEIISSYPEKVSELGEIQGVLEGLMKLIKQPICSSSKKASLFITYHAIASSSNQEGFTNAFLQMGLVPLLLENLVDAERSVCERALGVFDGICETKQGREEAYAHALTMPVIVKKILRVSDLATELSVSIVWKLVKHESREDEDEDEDGGVKVEALQVGAFQKLLLLLQVGCSEWTKEKATELLKLLNNLHRERLECIDSLDFKDLKRTF